MNYSLVLTAAGQGTRAKLGYNKMLANVSGEILLNKSLKVFLKDPDLNQIIVVVNSKDLQTIKEIIIQDKRIEFAIGGQSRQDSVYNGVKLSKNQYTFVHDGARPYLTNQDLNKLKSELTTPNKCVALVTDLVDSISQVKSGEIVQSLKRENYVRMLTPQVVPTNEYLNIFTQFQEVEQFTDEVGLIKAYTQVPVIAVYGEPGNIKLTNQGDFNENIKT